MIVALLTIVLTTTAFAEGPGSTKESNICSGIAKIRQIQQIRIRDAQVWEQNVVLSEEIQKLRKACDAFRNDAKQTGPELENLKSSQQTVSQLNKRFHEITSELYAEVDKAAPGLIGLGDTKCMGELKANKELIETKTKPQHAERVERFCDMSKGDDRKTKAAGDLGKEDKARKEMVQDALTNPRGANSVKLLAEAKAYAAANGMPDPTGGNANDRVCGERCIAILRAQQARTAYGEYSWQYLTAQETARNTRRSKYGRIF